MMADLCMDCFDIEINLSGCAEMAITFILSQRILFDNYVFVRQGKAAVL